MRSRRFRRKERIPAGPRRGPRRVGLEVPQLTSAGIADLQLAGILLRRLDELIIGRIGGVGGDTEDAGAAADDVVVEF